MGMRQAVLPSPISDDMMGHDLMIDDEFSGDESEGWRCSGVGGEKSGSR